MERGGRIWMSLLVLAAVGGAAAYWTFRHRRVEDARAARVNAEIDVAPAPLTGAPMLLGPSGKDSAGYPLQHVDRALLRSMLWHEQYDALTSRIEELQRAYETDWRAEDWVWDAVEALGAPELPIATKLDTWVATHDRSFVPRLVRGIYRVRLGYAQRGTAFANKTAREDLKLMRQTLAQADEDLEGAVSLRPSLVVARRGQMQAALAVGDDDRVRRTYDLALEICPLCFGPRGSFIKGLRPRWGGSHEEMLHFAKAERDRGNPRFKLLPGFIELDRAQQLVEAERPEEALAAAERACKVGEYWEFLLSRAKLRRKSDPKAALGDLDRALTLRPGEPAVLFIRAEVLGGLSRFGDAGRDLLAAMREEPVDPQGRRIRPYIVKGLLYETGQHVKAGRRPEALETITLALELDPRDADLQGKRASLVSSRSDSGQVSLAALKQRVQASPDDVNAVQEYDYALARRGSFQEVVDLWTAYLARHPDDARAHLERGGALFHLGRRGEAGADARRACELGLNEGCARARQLGVSTE